MRLDARKLDRRITFERPVPNGTFAGAGAGNWSLVDTVDAQVQDVLPSRAETPADGLSIAKRSARIRMRYRDDITADMRIVYGARIMQITAGPVELGREDGLELMTEDYSTAGGGA